MLSLIFVFIDCTKRFREKTKVFWVFFPLLPGRQCPFYKNDPQTAGKRPLLTISTPWHCSVKILSDTSPEAGFFPCWPLCFKLAWRLLAVSQQSWLFRHRWAFSEGPSPAVCLWSRLRMSNTSLCVSLWMWGNKIKKGLLGFAGESRSTAESISPSQMLYKITYIMSMNLDYALNIFWSCAVIKLSLFSNTAHTPPFCGNTHPHNGMWPWAGLHEWTVAFNDNACRNTRRENGHNGMTSTGSVCLPDMKGKTCPNNGV